MSRFDVIVPCYQYGHFLRACVASIVSQPVSDLRVIIVNDASPDSTAGVAAALAAEDPRIQVITHTVNRGHLASYNEALALIDGDYSLILSPDDLLTPGALERAATALDRYPAAGLCYGRDIVFTDERDLQQPSRVTDRVEYSSYAAFLQQSCELGHTPIQAPTAIMRTSAQKACGGFLKDLPHSGDTEIWLRLAATGGVVQVYADQAFRRIHQHNMSFDYSAVARLKEQVAAFHVHFRSLDEDRRNALDAILLRQVGESSFWTAMHAFDRGDRRTFDEALEFAVAISPILTTRREFRRLRIKRLLGIRMWSWLQPLFARSRRTWATHPAIPSL